MIILRGPSGSGKSTVAKEVRSRASSPTALIEQDYFRRIVLKEKDVAGALNIGLIQQTVTYALHGGYNVVLEGILFREHYGEMLGRLAARYHGHTFPYYFDIPFKETLIRHATKPNAHEFGEDQMRDWYAPMDTLGISGETIIGSDLSANDLVALILRETKI